MCKSLGTYESWRKGDKNLLRPRMVVWVSAGWKDLMVLDPVTWKTLEGLYSKQKVKNQACRSPTENMPNIRKSGD
jgi:hypothetical protein